MHNNYTLTGSHCGISKYLCNYTNIVLHLECYKEVKFCNVLEDKQ